MNLDFGFPFGYLTQLQGRCALYGKLRVIVRDLRLGLVLTGDGLCLLALNIDSLIRLGLLPAFLRFRRRPRR